MNNSPPSWDDQLTGLLEYIFIAGQLAAQDIDKSEADWPFMQNKIAYDTIIKAKREIKNHGNQLRIDELYRLLDKANIRKMLKQPGYPVGILDLHQRIDELKEDDEQFNDT